MTTSSYASTAVPPTLNNDLDFGSASFGDDMFSGLNRKESPPEPSREVAGRSLLSDKRTFQAEPIKINPKLEVEEPLKSWDSRGSGDNLMSSSRSDDESPPPPPPPHKYSSYAPIASESPTIPTHGTFQDFNAHHVRQSFMETKPYRESSPEHQGNSASSSYANSYDTPVSSRSASNKTNGATPKAPALAVETPYTDVEEDDLFTTTKATPKPEAPRPGLVESRSAPALSAGAGRVMTQAEFREYQKTQASKPQEDSDDEDYEDEEDAIKKREEEEIMRRKNQQMHFAREAMRRSTTAPGRPESIADTLTMGFPSETSMKADEWEDEDVPLGILAQHGFPSKTANRFPTQPTNAIPSYFPERPASAGAMSMGNRQSQAHLPAFARNLPVDPYIGGGLIRPSNRESMGFNSFNRGPGSVMGEPAGGMPLMYQDAGMSQPSLVDQIQMRDMTKPKYMGGASNKKSQGGPFTGMLGQQMNTQGQPQNPMRMSQMPAMNGMNTMNPMMNMMGGQMPMNGMGMNQMNFNMGQPQDQFMQFQQFQQMQQMIAMQQMQLQQMQAMQQPQQDPRMSMALPNNGQNLLGVPGVSLNGQNRPMSYMSGLNGNMNGAMGGMNGMQQQRPMSTFMGPAAGYTPSIAPSERSNIGLSARYRPVVNHSDSMSNGTSMTLQASGGANQKGAVKGILKKGSPQPLNEDEEDWGKMAARKSKMMPNGKEKQDETSLQELTRGLNL